MQLITQEDFSGTDRFLVQRIIGSGTFGVVYQVYDRENNTIIALKKLRDSICKHNIEALYRFKQEFRSLADVAHPNLVTLYELIATGEKWFFTMELVDGVNFINYIHGDAQQLSNISSTTKAAKDTLEDSPTVTTTSSIDKESISSDIKIIPSSFPLKTILSTQSITKLRNVLRQLALGIHTLHKSSKLHRDLKPSNVLVTNSSRVVILDFGLVIELNEFNTNNMEDDLVGTPTHMSPEQAAGLPITPASDWYSFGVMLYQALTGELPFSGKLFEILSKKQVLDPIRPSQRSENVPSDLDELCVALLQRDPNKRPNGSEILKILQDKHNHIELQHFSPSPQNIFVGRQNYLATLKEAFFDTQKDAMPSVVCVYGISGMGKTSLVRHFLEEIQQLCPRTLILSGRCYEQESVPYKVFDSLIDSLAQYLKHLLPSELNVLLVPEFLALTRLFPVLKSIPSFQSMYGNMPEIPDSQELRRRAFYALRNLLGKLAKKQPVILFVDDLQWGDIDSASLLEEIFCPPNPPAVMFIATYRSEKITDNFFFKSLSALKKEQFAKFWEVKISELSQQESYELVSKLMGEKLENSLSLVSVIAEESGGIPFFINELVQHIPIISSRTTTQTGEFLSLGKSQAGISTKNLQITSLEKVIYERIAALPIYARQLLEIVAIAGRPILRRIAKEVAGLEQEELSAITLLRSQHLIHFREKINQNEIEIYHDRIREAIIRHLSFNDRQMYHRNIANVLEHYEPIDPEVLVVHFLQAGNPEKTAKYAFEAAEKAHQALAFEQAAHFYQIALNLLPKDTNPEKLKDLNIKLATALASGGRGAESAQVFLIASEYAESEEWLDLQRRAAEQYLVCGLINEGLLMFETILNALGMQLASTPEEALTSMLAKRKEIEARGYDFEEKSEEELSPREKLQIDSCWSIVIGLTFIDTIRATEFQTHHLLFALQSGEPYRISRALCMEIGHRSSIGKASKAIVAELSNITEKILAKNSFPHSLGLYKLVLGSVAYFMGDWKTVYTLMKESEKIFREKCTNVPWEIDATKLYLFRALYFMGEIKEIAEGLPAMLKEVQDRGNLWVGALLHSRFYIVSLAQDLPEVAQEQLEEAISNWSKENFYMQHYWNLFGSIEIALYCQDGARAWHLISSYWAKLKNSMLLRVQVFFLESVYLYARSALTMAIFSDKPSEFLSIAENNAQEIEKQDAAWALPLALLIRASIAKDNDKDLAISLLAQAEEMLLATNMSLYAFSACYRRGQLTKDSELIEKASNWLKNQTIVNPAKIVDMLIPGIWETT